VTDEGFEACFRQMEYEQDVRQPADSRRRGQFKVGWSHATSGRRYSERTLKSLTWRNLGYRFANCPPTTDVDIEPAYKYMSREHDGKCS
jgi:hypothetical protein